MKSDIEIGSYLQNLRKERKMSLREVADHVGIDISMLSKIEHGERQLQSHMIVQKILQEFGDEPYLNEALQILATTNK